MGLKKGVERTLSTFTEVIQKVKDAVMQAFGKNVVPQSYFVSSSARAQLSFGIFFVFEVQQEFQIC